MYEIFNKNQNNITFLLLKVIFNINFIFLEEMLKFVYNSVKISSQNYRISSQIDDFRHKNGNFVTILEKFVTK